MPPWISASSVRAYAIPRRCCSRIDTLACVLQQSSSAGSLMLPSTSSAGFGDLRLGAKLGVLRQKSFGVDGAATISVGFPSAKDASYIGEAGPVAEPGLVVGDNEPYHGALEDDTMWTHGTRRGLPHALIEIRQDLIETAAGVARMTDIVARALRRALAQAGLPA